MTSISIPPRRESPDSEARAYLQARLRFLSKILFWNFVVLLAYLTAIFTVYDHIKPPLHNYVLLMSAGGMLCLVAIWTLLRRRELPLRQLRAIDAFYSIATGT
ncbi:MAG TPA: hypothetical protein VL326_36350, partial [Kofleriaceae bacterium]|nr:hypothetical protein [Kofleriaceae bacterium]